MKKVISLAIILTLVFTAALTLDCKTANAKSEEVYYSGCLSGTKSDETSYGSIYKCQLKENELIIWGSLMKWSDKYNKRKYLKYKKRVFKLSKNTEFYEGGPEGVWELSKKELKKAIKMYNGLDFNITVKNGKVILIQISA